MKTNRSPTDSNYQSFNQDHINLSLAFGSDIISNIFSNLEFTDLENCRLVNHDWKNRANYRIFHMLSDENKYDFSYLIGEMEESPQTLAKKYLKYLKNDYGIKIVTHSDFAISIEVRATPNVPLEKISNIIKKLNLLFDEISIEFTPTCCTSMEDTNNFVTEHGQFIHSLNLRELENLINDDNLKSIIESCPNTTKLSARSNAVTGRHFQGLLSRLDLKVLDLSGCTALDIDISGYSGELDEDILPHSLEEINLSGCTGLKDLDFEWYVNLRSINLEGCSALRTVELSECSKLEVLSIKGCRVLDSLKVYSPYLKSLNIEECHDLEKLYIDCDLLTSLEFESCKSLSKITLLNWKSSSKLKLPSSLKKLKFEECMELKSLPSYLPEGLTKLELYDCPNLVNFPSCLPHGLTNLCLIGCTSLKKISTQFPELLTELIVRNCTSLTNLPSPLPTNLVSLDLSYSHGLILPTSLPAGLKNLELGSTCLTAFPGKMPAGLENLDLSGCSNFTHFEDPLPATLKNINLSGCTGLTTLPDPLPAYLETLNLSGCTGLTSFPDHLPDGLKRIDLSGCTSLTNFPTLTGGLKRIDFSGCIGLTKLEGPMPAGLETLNLSGCTGLKNLEDPFSPNLRELNLTGCHGITKLNLSGCSHLRFLSSLPKNLESLDLSGCRSLNQFAGEFPQGLISLNLSGCTNLSKIPNFPETLKELNLSGYSKLDAAPPLPKGLTSLDLSYTDITTLTLAGEGLEKLNLSDCTNLQAITKFPNSLREINISGCNALKHLPLLPEGLLSLNLSRFIHVQSFTHFPKNMTTLNFSHCKNLENIDNLPETLASLNCSGCSKLKSIPNLPKGLISLDLTGLNLIEKIETLPENITHLSFSGCSKLKSIPNLPKGLISLDLARCSDLEIIDTLPETITDLCLYGCSKLETIPNFPKSLISLNISHCTGLLSIPELPVGLKKFELNTCISLSKLPALPEGLEILELYGCSSLRKLTFLPTRLKQLNLTGCSALASLPDRLPEELLVLLLTNCIALAKLPPLPDSLVTFYLENCKALASFPGQLPSNLRVLNLAGCTALAKLPELPQSLEFLHFYGCKALTKLPSLPKKLTSINLSGCIALRKLPATLPDSLTELILTDSLPLSELPAKLPDGMETLTLSGCANLKRLPDQLPTELKILILDGCNRLKSIPPLPLGLKQIVLPTGTTLADDARLEVFKSFFDRNLIERLPLKDFNFNDIQTLCNFLFAKLFDFKSAPKELLNAAKLITQNTQSLYINLQGPAFLQAKHIIIASELKGPENPFTLFKKLKKLSRQPLDFILEKMSLGDANLAINVERLEMLSQGSKIKRENLPKIVNLVWFNDLFNHLKRKVQDNPQIANNALNDLGANWAMVETPINSPTQFLRGLLNVSGEVSDIEAKWRAVLHNIAEKDSTQPADKFFTEQEQVFITTIRDMQACDIGKTDVINALYEHLDYKYHYKVELPKQTSAEDERKVNEAIQYVRDFININQENGLTLENLVEELAQHINEKNYCKERSAKIYSLIQSLEFWSEEDMLLNEAGALQLLKIAFSKINEEFVTQYINQTIQKIMDAQLMENDALMFELTGENVIRQGSHQTTYLKNLIGQFIGINHKLTFDIHTELLYKNMLEKERLEVLKIFFKHVTPQLLVDAIIASTSKASTETKNAFKAFMENKFWDDMEDTINGAGVLQLLRGFKYLI